jgi:hypothetical protein
MKIAITITHSHSLRVDRISSPIVQNQEMKCIEKLTSQKRLRVFGIAVTVIVVV